MIAKAGSGHRCAAQPFVRAAAFALLVMCSGPTAGRAAAEDVIWTNLVNGAATGNSLQKTSGCDGCDDAGAVSQQQITSADGYVEFTASETTTVRVIGLSHGNTDTTWGDIDFAIALWNGGGVSVHKNGAYEQCWNISYVPGDVFRIAVESGIVNYYKNGTLICASTTPPTYPLLVDTALLNLNATINNAVIAVVSPPPTSSPPPSGQELMPADVSGWQPFAPLAQSAPAVSTSSGPDGYALNISGGGVPNVYGGWKTRISGIMGGNTYRFSARALPANITSLRESITILLRWSGSFGAEVAPDYVWEFRPAQQPQGALLFDRVIQAPSGSTALDVELVLQWSANGQVAFDKLSLTPSAALAPRMVRVAAIYYRPSGTQSGQESVQQAASHAEQVAMNHRPDIMVLGEQLNVIGAPGTLGSKAEAVPGASTDIMAGVARRQGVNIVFGLLERIGNQLYNTAVLLDRSGNIAGKYHKVQLPLPEAYAGITPGDSVPLFDTDFGRVALLICHDLSFPETAREAALGGAELLLVPFWGGRASLVRARAVEQGMYLAVSGYDYPSEVINPLGSVLASTGEVTGAPGVAVADIDLNQRFRENWLGDWRDISNKERRTTPYQYRVP